jgi:DUF4097 and DUF4098 domain-containing protein YvlB
MTSFDTPHPLAVTVDLVLGDLRVTASDRADTLVTVEPTDPSKPADVDAAHDTRVECTDTHLTITAPKSWKRFSPFDNGGSVQVTVDVPTGSSLEASSSLGAVRADGELDRCRIKTGMGNVRLDHTAALTLKTGHGDVDVDHAEGDADITTGSGDVRTGTVDGAATIKNSNGATTIDRVTGDVRVKAANGDITIGRAERSVVARSAAGSIEVGSLRRGVADLETAVGDLSCGLADGTTVDLDVRSKHGRIHSGLDSSDGPAPTDEVLRLRAHTTVGDISLYRTGDRAQRTA